MIIVTDSHPSKPQLRIPVHPTGWTTDYGFNCIPYTVMLKKPNSNAGYRVFPASDSPVSDNPSVPGRKLLASFHKSFLTSSQLTKSYLQPISASTARYACNYQAGDHDNNYLPCYTISNREDIYTGEQNAAVLFNDIWFGGLFINGDTFCPYAFWNVDHSMRVNMYAAYYVLLVKGSASDVQDEIADDGYTMCYFYGDMGSDYRQATHTMTTTINKVYDHSVENLSTGKTDWYGKTCDVRILSQTKINGSNYCVISVTKYNHNDYLLNDGQWFTMPYVCHANPDAYIIFGGMEAYGVANP